MASSININASDTSRSGARQERGARFPRVADSNKPLPNSPGRPQSSLSLSQNKDRIATNERRRLGGGWLDLNNGAQAGP